MQQDMDYGWSTLQAQPATGQNRSSSISDQTGLIGQTKSFANAQQLGSSTLQQQHDTLPLPLLRQAQCMPCRVDKRSGPRCNGHTLCRRCSAVKGYIADEYSLLNTEFLDWKGWFKVREVVGDFEKISHNPSLPEKLVLKMRFRDRLMTGMIDEDACHVDLDMTVTEANFSLLAADGQSSLQALRIDIPQLDQFVRTHVWNKTHQVSAENWTVEEEHCLLETVQMFTGYLGLLTALSTTTVNPMGTYCTFTPATLARELVFTFVFRLQALFFEIGLHCNAIVSMSDGSITSTPLSSAMETAYRVLKSLMQEDWNLPSDPPDHPLIELRKEVVSRGEMVLGIIGGYECLCSGVISRAAKLPVPKIRKFAEKMSKVGPTRFPQQLSITVHDVSRLTLDSSGFDTINTDLGLPQSVFNLLYPDDQDPLTRPDVIEPAQTYIDLDNTEVDIRNLLRQDRQRREPQVRRE